MFTAITPWQKPIRTISLHKILKKTIGGVIRFFYCSIFWGWLQASSDLAGTVLQTQKTPNSNNQTMSIFLQRNTCLVTFPYLLKFTVSSKVNWYRHREKVNVKYTATIPNFNAIEETNLSLCWLASARVPQHLGQGYQIGLPACVDLLVLRVWTVQTPPEQSAFAAGWCSAVEECSWSPCPL